MAAPARRYDRLANEPALDGLRALAVLAVVVGDLRLAGVAGLEWLPGGFSGLEVLFVVAAFLVTARLRTFALSSPLSTVAGVWRHYARDRFPGLWIVIIGATVAASVWYRAALGRLRGDAFAAVLYISNWRQILDHIGHFAAPDPLPLLRHLWPLAVEAQWWVVAAPLLAWAVSRGEEMRLPSVAVLVVAALFAGALTAAVFDPHETLPANFAYLSTITRMGGLCLGAALALAWAPWAGTRARRPVPGLDALGCFAVAGLGALAMRLHMQGVGTYRVPLAGVGGPRVLPGGLFAAGVLSAVVVAAATHPGVRVLRAALSIVPLVEIGRRTYALYLWHWPVFVVARVGDSRQRLGLALVLTAVLTEITYRGVLLPVRRGAPRRWISGWRAARGAERQRWTVSLAMYVIGTVTVVSAVTVGLLRATPPVIGRDTTVVRFDGTAVFASTTIPDAVFTGPVPTTTLPRLPRRVVVVGDGQARSLVVNRPLGIDQYVTLSDGSVPRCDVWTGGRILTAQPGGGHRFSGCSRLAARWAASASAARAEVALVVVGEWDVFDVEVGGHRYDFGTPPFDNAFLARLADGIGALKRAGTKIALLAVPCMRPIDVPGSAEPPYAERADDARPAHLNELLRRAAADDPAFVTYIDGPAEWCDGSPAATDPSVRWDGVHVYAPGAELVWKRVVPELLRIPL